MEYRTYLDIETTGLSPAENELTVLGIYKENGSDDKVIQMIGDEISRPKLINALKNTSILYTYNGSRFDLPFIKAKLGIDLVTHCTHEDLMYACWKQKLKGGLKSVERQLGIERELTDINGLMAIQLWYEYIDHGNKNSLSKLLRYNKEDVVNLKELRERLKD